MRTTANNCCPWNFCPGHDHGLSTNRIIEFKTHSDIKYGQREIWHFFISNLFSFFYLHFALSELYELHFSGFFWHLAKSNIHIQACHVFVLAGCVDGEEPTHKVMGSHVSINMQKFDFELLLHAGGLRAERLKGGNERWMQTRQSPHIFTPSFPGTE